MTRRRTQAGGNNGQQAWRPVDRPADTQACTNLRTGPHNRCTHPTPPPPATIPCAGDPGCPYRIPTHLARGGRAVCPWHTELAIHHDAHQRLADLMGAA